ncbi:MAG: hypothetical protein HGA67_01315 [Candidatus Yonathbacteria bacterium]|nr:hypothetical protein [Candidatus Yonathbacteria bacterium]
MEPFSDTLTGIMNEPSTDTPAENDIDTVVRDARNAVDDAARDMRRATDALIIAMQKEEAARKEYKDSHLTS